MCADWVRNPVIRKDPENVRFDQVAAGHSAPERATEAITPAPEGCGVRSAAGSPERVASDLPGTWMDDDGADPRDFAIAPEVVGMTPWEALHTNRRHGFDVIGPDPNGAPVTAVSAGMAAWVTGGRPWLALVLSPVPLSCCSRPRSSSVPDANEG